MKRCPSCKSKKSLDLFDKNKARHDGLSSYCTDCERIRCRIKKKKYYQKNREVEKSKARIYYERHGDVVRAKAREWAHKLRMDVLIAYSKGKLECNCCGEREIKFLTIDHINNNGAIHRRTISKHRNGGAWLTKLRTANYPPGFQVLCYNCNCSKGRYGKCPHKIKNMAKKQKPKAQSKKQEGKEMEPGMKMSMTPAQKKQAKKMMKKGMK